jgi:colanic acid/amylovoran biosynthesis glycosyltransferase
VKIAVIVHGRFHAFDLARALTARGNDVHVFTNYPKWAAARFGLRPEAVHSLWQHGVALRAVQKLGDKAWELACPSLDTWFSKWASKELRCGEWDVIHSFSGVAENIFLSELDARRHFMVRGSSHIRYQDQILREESGRAAVPLERPTQWIIDREEREYALCDQILLLSTFALDSFVEHGVPRSKLSLFPLGVDTRSFRPTEEALNARLARILSGEPLRITFTGTLNYRKGLFDLDRIVRAVDPKRFQFEIIGSVPPEGKEVAAKLPANVVMVPRQPQAKLPEWYKRGDVFLFPTLEDGFAVVLAQAYANALPIITTTNCAGPDMIRNGESGWVLPIRRPDLFIEQLLWCDAHRDKLADVVRRLYDSYRARDWNDVAADFERIVSKVAGRPAKNGSAAESGRVALNHG